MYSWVLYYDPISDDLFCIQYYLDGLMKYENLPDRFFDFDQMGRSRLKFAMLVERPWFDDYLENNGCVAIGHVN